MHTNIRKWGNSLGLRIPRAFAEELGLADGAVVDLTLQDRTLVLRPVSSRDLALADLLAGITDDQLHPEDDTGPAQGGESW